MKKVCAGIAITIIVCMVVSGIYGIYNILTDTGRLAGFYGVIIFELVEPVLFLLLEVDVLCLYLYNRKQKKKNDEETENFR